MTYILWFCRLLTEIDKERLRINAFNSQGSIFSNENYTNKVKSILLPNDYGIAH